MNYLTADRELWEKLEGVEEPIEIRDPKGKLLGRFTPSLSVDEIARYEESKKMFDPAEVKRRKETEHGCGYTLEQVLDHLQSLETSG